MIAGEIPCAIVGGIQILLSPYPFVGFSKASMLSPDGRCRAFDADGNGYVRADGGAVFVLKPLAQAVADGDRVHAVIAKTGTNSDGFTNTLTVPNAEAQEALLRQVYRDADIRLDKVDYVEAHGTGTAVGDPIEAAAIGRVFGQARNADKPLPIGSVKSNIGHLEPASGMAGLTKVVQCLKNRAIPASLHFQTPNPNIPFDDLNIRVVTQLEELGAGGRPLTMGVNSFGFGGANAHAILRSAPKLKQARNRPGPPPSGCPPLLFSAHTQPALKDMAASILGLLPETPDAATYYALAHALRHRRQEHKHRLAVMDSTPAGARSKLEAFCQGVARRGVVTGPVLARTAPLVFVFSGNGCQWMGMGRSLLETEAQFRREVDRVDECFTPLAGFSIRDELCAGPDDSRMEFTEVAQPALFAVQLGILAVLRARGLEAQTVLGHSVGELAAAFAAGALSLEQAVQVIHSRSTVQGKTRGRGKMAAVGLPVEQIQDVLNETGCRATIAAINSSNSVTLAGDPGDLERIGAHVKQAGFLFKMLALEYAFHSEVMDSVRSELLTSLADLRPRQRQGAAPRFVSTVTGEYADPGSLGPDYWWRNIREPVRLHQALKAVVADGNQVFMEIGPHPIMQSYILETLRSAGESGRVLPTLKRDDTGLDALLDACAGAQVCGCELNGDRLVPRSAPHVDLPRFPWQKQRFWFTKTPESFDLITGRQTHPLLGYPVAHVAGVWEAELDADRIGYLGQHVVGGNVLFPATGFVEMALAAAHATFNALRIQIHELEIRKPLAFEPNEVKVLQFHLSKEDGTFRIQSRTRLLDQPWLVHAVGKLSDEVNETILGGFAPNTRDSDLDTGIPQPVEESRHYERAAELGLDYGPAFQSLATTSVHGRMGVGELRIPEEIEADLPKYLLHPALADGCLQLLFAIPDQNNTTPTAMVPISFHRIDWQGAHGAPARCRARLITHNRRSVTLDLSIQDASENTIAVLRQCRFRAIDLSRSRKNRLMALEQTRVLAPRRGQTIPSAMPDTPALLKTLKPAVRRYTEALRGIGYEQEVEPLFDALATAIAFRAMRNLSSDAGSSLSIESVCQSASVNRRYFQLLTYLCSILEEDGLLLRDGPVWTWVAQAEFEQPEDIWRAIIADHPGLLPEVLPIVSISQQLAPALRDSRDEDGDSFQHLRTTARDRLFGSSPIFRPLTIAARNLVESIAESWPEDRDLRVAEIYGGGAALASEFAGETSCRHFEYVVLAINDAAFDRAQAEESNIVTKVAHWRPETTVDEHDEDSKQEYEGAFDIVIASDTFGDGEGYVRALLGLRSLLVADGRCILLQRGSQRLSNIVFGTLPDWWRVTPDPARPTPRSLRPRDLESLLLGQGFSDITGLPNAKDGIVSPAYIVLGRAAAATDTRIVLQPEHETVIFADQEGPSLLLALQLQKNLCSANQAAEIYFVRSDGAAHANGNDEQVIDGGTAEGFSAFIDEHFSIDVGTTDFVFLCGLTSDHVPEGKQLLDSVRDRCVLAANLIRGLKTANPERMPRLWLVTTGVLNNHSSAKTVNPSEAPLWGFGRVLANEWPALECRRIDLDPAVDLSRLAAPLALEIRDPGIEDEIRLEATGRYTTRVIKTMPTDTQDEHPRADKNQSIRLKIDSPGSLHHLIWRTAPRTPPGDGELEIRVYAAGLNFRDVMYSIGMLPDEAIETGFSGASLGLECAGRVVAVGPGVSDFAVGEPVLGFARSSFATHLTTSVGAVVKMPAQWTYEQAATVPSAFFTTYYALAHLAKLEAGDRVLIHGAAGGVGLAAVQYAHHQGAEIFATAGTEEKREFLRGLGVQHVHDSRSLAYSDEILAATAGEGIDVVLNSLAGESVARSLAILRPFGRFLELGKRDYFENNKIGLRPFRKNISYFAIDADQLLHGREELSKRLFAQVMDLFEKGAFRPLPHYIYSAERVVDAFRFMQQSKQIGKVVISMEDHPKIQRSSTIQVGNGLKLDTKASYLVTGGLSGFGGATAEWLVKKGARHLILISRSGAERAEAGALLDRIAGTGVEVHVAKADVSDEADLRRVLEGTAKTMPPLRGVIHSAMVLDDGAIENLDAERFERVLAPKILGAWHLHTLTKHLAIDFFVMYSSGATLFGNPGQANYVAANAYLEALAQYRRSLDLPALAVGWGVLEDVGFAAGREDLREFLLSRFGNRGIAGATALSTLEDLLISRRSGLSIVDLDLGALKRGWRGRIAPRYHKLLADVPEDSTNTGTVAEFHDTIKGMSDEDALGLIGDLLLHEIAHILHMPGDQIDRTISIANIGVDSLMATELGAAIEERLGVDLPLILAADGVTIADLAAKILEQLRQTGLAQESDITGVLRRQVTDIASRHSAELSDEQVESLVTTLKDDSSTPKSVRLTS